MDINAVKALLAPISDGKFEASLHRQLGKLAPEDSVTLEEVGLDKLARKVVAERDGKGDLGHGKLA